MAPKQKPIPKPEAPEKLELHPEPVQGVPHIGVYPYIPKGAVPEEKPAIDAEAPKKDTPVKK